MHKNYDDSAISGRLLDLKLSSKFLLKDLEFITLLGNLSKILEPKNLFPKLKKTFSDF